AAGSLLDLVSGLTGTGVAQLWERARSVPPGADGLVVLPWLGGARAPWWNGSARAGLIGLEAGHGPGELARAALEAVAWDITRCLAVAAEAGAAGARGFETIALAGGGARERAWTDVLTAICGLPARRRRSGEAASAGAALLGWQALGMDADLDAFDPVVEELPVDDQAAARYRALRPAADAAATAVIGLRPSGDDAAD
ncbi:MAG TPA: FGGY-family carbohydrate kinase, partial [Acidimicrobiales bacterium]|nr:FGGY-family carbohydrate kinase [Acidimicrobiales bacterium]